MGTKIDCPSMRCGCPLRTPAAALKALLPFHQRQGTCLLVTVQPMFASAWQCAVCRPKDLLIRLGPPVLIRMVHACLQVHHHPKNWEDPDTFNPVSAHVLPTHSSWPTCYFEWVLPS